VKILIIKPSALGDIVQALPVLTGLKRHWPNADIDWIVNDTLREILDGHPCLRRTILYPR
jgi:ADP-heptose:LPS heptosyltransferase